MRFRVEHLFPAPLHDVERALFDPSFMDCRATVAALGHPELLRSDDDGSVVRQESRHRYSGPLPPGADRFIDPKRLTWVLEATHDRSTHAGTWVVRPDHYADRLACTATVRLVAEGTETRRVLDGELTAKVPLVGGRVERAIVGNIGDNLGHDVPLVAAWLEGSR